MLRKTYFILAAALIAGTWTTAQSEAAPTITTKHGEVAGSVVDGVESWKGIPFAAPPVNELRWRAPQPVAPWTGIRDATAFASDCTQLPFGPQAFNMRTTPSEDCLYLNVWRPAAKQGPLPVLVWIYGGGWVIGGTSAPIYEGANLAKKDMVVVSLNYRIGRFGFFAHPKLTEEDPDNGKFFNYGTLDQIAALQWIRENIEAFGGDVENITVMGESAGGVSIHALLTSPLNDGLFHKAIIMSGANGDDLGTGTLRDAEGLGVNFAARKGISPSDPDALSKLRALSAEEVLDGLTFMTPPTDPLTFNGGGPVEDGSIVAKFGEAYKAGEFKKIPLMVGATADDLGGRTGFMVAGARQFSLRQAKQGVPVFQYRFSYIPPASPEKTAVHAMDIPFFLRTVSSLYRDAATEADHALAESVTGYVKQFAYMEADTQSIGNWTKFTKASDPIMIFSEDGSPRLLPDPWTSEIDQADPPHYPGLQAGGAGPLPHPVE